MINNKERVDSKLFDTQLDDFFSDITATLRNACNSSFAQIMVLASHKQWVQSLTDISISTYDEVPPIIGFTINHRCFFEVSDLEKDTRFTQPFYIQEQPVAHYAGVPLIMPNGDVIGVLCIMNNVSKMLDEQQQLILDLFAKELIAKLVLNKKDSELEELKRVNQFFLHSTSDLISITDHQSNLIQCNSAFLAQYPSSIYHSKSYTDDIECVIESVLSPLGEEKTLSTKKIAFTHSDNEPCIFSITQDITQDADIARLTTSLNKELDEFTSIVTHDLKSPLNAIKNLTDWIEEDDAKTLSESSFKYFSMLKNSIKRMEMLLNDLRYYAKAGRNQVTAEQISFGQLISDCYTTFELPASFTLNYNECEITLPKEPLVFILTQLITNAFKHHDKPEGIINVECIEHEKEYMLTVSDDGPGIKDTLQDKIFLPFQKLKSKDEVEGSGLGLALVKKVLGAYSGLIQVTSQIDNGSTFTVTWPKNIKI